MQLVKFDFSFKSVNLIAKSLQKVPQNFIVPSERKKVKLAYMST